MTGHLVPVGNEWPERILAKHGLQNIAGRQLPMLTDNLQHQALLCLVRHYQVVSAIHHDSRVGVVVLQNQIQGLLHHFHLGAIQLQLGISRGESSRV